MFEVGEANFIKNNEYLQNYDLVDIPFNEFHPVEDKSYTINLRK